VDLLVDAAADGAGDRLMGWGVPGVVVGSENELQADALVADGAVVL
jgi:hypothetical protein